MKDANLSNVLAGLMSALMPFAELGVDLTDLHCHKGIVPVEQCGRCKQVLAARQALDDVRGPVKVESVGVQDARIWFGFNLAELKELIESGVLNGQHHDFVRAARRLEREQLQEAGPCECNDEACPCGGKCEEPADLSVSGLYTKRCPRCAEAYHHRSVSRLGR